MLRRQIPQLLKHLNGKNALFGANNMILNAVTTKSDQIPSLSSHHDLDSEDSWFMRRLISARTKLGLVPRPKAYYRVRGLTLFRDVERVQWENYFRELHMWMLLVRGGNEGREGDLIKQFSLQYMWEGAQKRASQLEATSAVRRSFDDLYDEMVAAFVMYDYGLLTSDVELANALWYRFLQEKCEDPEKLELLVKHVRNQIHLLDQLSKEDVIDKAKVTWLPLSDKTCI